MPAVEEPEQTMQSPEINAITDSVGSEPATGERIPPGEDGAATESGYIVIE